MSGSRQWPLSGHRRAAGFLAVTDVSGTPREAQGLDVCLVGGGGGGGREKRKEKGVEGESKRREKGGGKNRKGGGGRKER